LIKNHIKQAFYALNLLKKNALNMHTAWWGFKADTSILAPEHGAGTSGSDGDIADAVCRNIGEFNTQTACAGHCYLSSLYIASAALSDPTHIISYDNLTIMPKLRST